MMRVARRGLNTADECRLSQYQAKVDLVRATGATPVALKACVDRQWTNFGRTKLRTRLVGYLSEMSHNYCVYCGYNHGEEIDHFDPISRNPGHAFVWTNYNWSCGICNGAKLAEFALDPQGNPLLLNPTGPTETGDFFVLSRTSGRLIPNPAKPVLEQERAIYTRNTLNLNREALAEERRRHAATFTDNLQRYTREPTIHGEAVLLGYLDQAEHLQLVVYLTVRSLDPEVQPLVAQWLALSPPARAIVYARNWLPIV